MRVENPLSLPQHDKQRHVQSLPLRHNERSEPCGSPERGPGVPALHALDNIENPVDTAFYLL